MGTNVFKRIARTLEKNLMKIEDNKKSERFTEELFCLAFTLLDFGTRACRNEVPKITAPSGTWTPDGVLFHNDTLDVFEFKKPKIELSSNGNPIANSSAYFQAVRYIVGSHAYKAERQINRIFCFNSKDLVLVEPTSSERLAYFLKQPFWESLKSEDKSTIEREFKKRSDLINAYFPITHIASLPVDELGNRSKFYHQVTHFYENSFEALGIESLKVREIVTGTSLKQVYSEFSDLVLEEPEKHFISFAPVWTKRNLFHFARNGYLYIIDKSGREVSKIRRQNIVNEDIDAIESFLKYYALDNPETFYDNYDTLLPKQKRKDLGSYFTKKGLASFAQYFVLNLVKDFTSHHVLDPAAGSGTLLSGVLARSVFGSDLFQFKNLLMDERNVRNLGQSIDFLTTTPGEYVNLLNDEIGDVVDNPLLVFSNPPYLGTSGREELEDSLKSEIETYGMRSRDLYSYFLTQISRLFEGEHNGLGKDLEGYVCVFTPDTWIHERGEQQEFRDYILSKFKYVSGFLVDGAKFFDDMSQPVLFSVLQFKKGWKFQQNQKLPFSNILDLTQGHREINKLTEEWGALPAVARFGFEKMEDVVPHTNLKKINGLKSLLFKKKYKKDRLEWINKRVRFSKVLTSSHSQTGGNELALSEAIVRSSSDIKDIANELKRKAKIANSTLDIIKKLQLVFDDSSDRGQGYRFVLKDKNKFPSQSLPNPKGPVLNYFEELKKSTRDSKFFNLAPITTDVAVCELSKDPVVIKEGDVFKACGFKKINKQTVEYEYLTEYQEKVGDLRGIMFLRAFLYHLPEFKELVRDKSINASLVWLPEIRDPKTIRSLIALSFAHTISTTFFEELEIVKDKTTWRAEDFFHPDGWLKEAGIFKSLHIDLMSEVDTSVKKSCQHAVSQRRKGKTIDEDEIIRLGSSLFGDAGFLPSGDSIIVEEAA